MLACKAGWLGEECCLTYSGPANAAKETGLGKLFLFRRVNIQDQNITEQFWNLTMEILENLTYWFHEYATHRCIKNKKEVSLIFIYAIYVRQMIIFLLWKCYLPQWQATPFFTIKDIVALAATKNLIHRISSGVTPRRA